MQVESKCCILLHHVRICGRTPTTRATRTLPRLGCCLPFPLRKKSPPFPPLSPLPPPPPPPHPPPPPAISVKRMQKKMPLIIWQERRRRERRQPFFSPPNSAFPAFFFCQKKGDYSCSQPFKGKNFWQSPWGGVQLGFCGHFQRKLRKKSCTVPDQTHVRTPVVHHVYSHQDHKYVRIGLWWGLSRVAQLGPNDTGSPQTRDRKDWSGSLRNYPPSPKTKILPPPPNSFIFQFTFSSSFLLSFLVSNLLSHSSILGHDDLIRFSRRNRISGFFKSKFVSDFFLKKLDKILFFFNLDSCPKNPV